MGSANVEGADEGTEVSFLSCIFSAVWSAFSTGNEGDLGLLYRGMSRMLRSADAFWSSPRLARTSHWFGRPRQQFQEPHHTIFWNNSCSENMGPLLAWNKLYRLQGCPFFVNRVYRRPCLRELGTLYASWLPSHAVVRALTQRASVPSHPNHTKMYGWVDTTCHSLEPGIPRITALCCL